MGVVMAKLVPVWEIIEKVFAEKGIKLSAGSTLKICDRITKEINEELTHTEREGKMEV
jgi:hypothetical protein